MKGLGLNLLALPPTPTFYSFHSPYESSSLRSFVVSAALRLNDKSFLFFKKRNLEFMQSSVFSFRLIDYV